MSTMTVAVSQGRPGSIIMLAQQSPAATKDITVEALQRLMEGGSTVTSVVILDGYRPVGLVMSYDLDRKLGRQFGREVYLRREVINVMNESPLVVDGAASIKNVASEAMKREDIHLYDDIIVTNEGRYAGTVTVQNLLVSLARVESVFAMAGGVCHEMNQPLQVLMSGLELFSLQKGRPENSPELVDIIRDQIHRIHSITQRLHAITTYSTKPYINGTIILDLDQSARLMVQ